MSNRSPHDAVQTLHEVGNDLLREIDQLKSKLRYANDRIADIWWAHDLDFKAFIVATQRAFDNGPHVDWSSVIEGVLTAYGLKSLFELTEKPKLIAPVAIALGFTPPRDPIPVPAGILSCTICDKHFHAKHQQLRAAKMGQRVFCSDDCRGKSRVVLLGSAARFTYKQLIKAGWNDQMLIANGLMKAPRENSAHEQNH